VIEAVTPVATLVDRLADEYRAARVALLAN